MQVHLTRSRASTTACKYFTDTAGHRCAAVKGRLVRVVFQGLDRWPCQQVEVPRSEWSTRIGAKFCKQPAEVLVVAEVLACRHRKD